MNVRSWMSDLAGVIGNQKLRTVTIPGTHDSATYSLTPSSGISTDDSGADMIEKIENFAPPGIIQEVAANYGRAQSQTILRQLELGIRYLDFRLCLTWDQVRGMNESNEVFICHGLFGPPAAIPLQDIRTFVNANPREIVIVDMNHFYCFTESSHDAFLDQIESIFALADGSSLLVPRSMGVDVTPNQIWAQAGRVILLYGGDQQGTKGITPNSTGLEAAIRDRPLIWPRDGGIIKSKWFKHASTVSALYPAMQDELHTSAEYTGFWVDQGILSFDTTYMELHPGETLEGLSLPATRAVASWIRYLWMGSPLNITIVNFFEQSYYAEASINANVTRQNAWLYDASTASPRYDIQVVHLDPRPVVCDPTDAVVGAYFATSSSLPGTTGQLRLVPVLLVTSLDGKDPSVRKLYNQGEPSSTLLVNSSFIDTTPLYCPSDQRVVGVQFAWSGDLPNTQSKNRFLLELLCADEDGSNQVAIYNTQDNTEYVSSTNMDLVMTELQAPALGPVLGIALIKSTPNRGFCYSQTNVLAPAIVYNAAPARAVLATWSSSQKTSSGAIEESAGTWYNCPAGYLMVGRKHDDGEDGDTWYYAAPVRFRDQTVTFSSPQTSNAISESAGIPWEAASGQVMVGRCHSGNDNGSTWYKQASIAASGGGRVTLGMRLWSPTFDEDDSSYTCPANTVMTGRFHTGNDKGKSQIEYAPILFTGGD